jgi:hypothetical protein
MRHGVLHRHVRHRRASPEVTGKEKPASRAGLSFQARPVQGADAASAEAEAAGAAGSASLPPEPLTM